MAPKGENSKKAAGNVRKAQAAAEKQAAKEQANSTAENAKWQQGAKTNAKA